MRTPRLHSIDKSAMKPDANKKIKQDPISETVDSTIQKFPAKERLTLFEINSRAHQFCISAIRDLTCLVRSHISPHQSKTPPVRNHASSRAHPFETPQNRKFSRVNQFEKWTLAVRKQRKLNKFERKVNSSSSKSEWTSPVRKLSKLEKFMETNRLLLCASRSWNEVKVFKWLT